MTQAPSGSDSQRPVWFRAVVTGASSGIGRQTAIELAARWGHGNDARMIIHYRGNVAGARSTADAVERAGVRTQLVAADLSVSADRERLVDQAWEFLERPNIWVNLAGADVLTGQAAEASFAEKFQLLMAVDVVGTIELSRTVAFRMVAEQSAKPFAEPPSMTFVGWDQAPLGMEGDAGQMFGPVKAAIMAFANSLAQDVAPDVRVNTVAPGWIKTAWGETTSDYWNRRATGQSLMNRWGSPGDVAMAICYLADPRNSFCTAQTLCVNGGWNRSFVPRDASPPDE